MELSRFCCKNGRRSTSRAENHLETTTRRYDECGCLVVKSLVDRQHGVKSPDMAVWLTKAVCIWTNLFGVTAVRTWLADIRAIVLPRATVQWTVVLGAGRKARIKKRPLKVVIGIWVDAVTGFRWRVQHQIPRTPFLDVIKAQSLIEWDGKR